MPAADIRTRGDATAGQRAELKRLLETKRYTKEWRDRLFDDIRTDGGLTKNRATAVTNWLSVQPNLDGTPIHATTEQIDRIHELLRQRVAPGPWARQIRDRIAGGTLTFDQADLYLNDLERLPKRVFVAPAGPRPGTPGADAPDGYFALTGGDDQVRCYRIHTLKSGQRVVDKFTGDKTSQRRRRLYGWKATQVLREVAADVPTAARLFAKTREHCSECNQPLHDQEQDGFAHGYGPDCWDKRQAAAAARSEPLIGDQS